MGLKKSFQIGKILIHPKDPNIVYVGALGRLYGPNEERGLFKTEDGGKTWKKVLYVDDKTGVIDMRMDPIDPNTLLVGMWERKRDEFDGLFGPPTDWSSPDQYGPTSRYGPGGGLFTTTDARQDVEEAHRREGRDRPADREDRPHRPRLLAQDQGPGVRHHRHREGRQGPAAADGVHGHRRATDEKGGGVQRHRRSRRTTRPVGQGRAQEGRHHHRARRRRRSPTTTR